MRILKELFASYSNKQVILCLANVGREPLVMLHDSGIVSGILLLQLQRMYVALIDRLVDTFLRSEHIYDTVYEAVNDTYARYVINSTTTTDITHTTLLSTQASVTRLRSNSNQALIQLVPS